MLRKEKEVVGFENILGILERCTVLHIAFKGEEYPYLVPVSFGIIRDGDRADIYIHCARQGLKIDCASKNPKICFEGEIFYKTEELPHGITSRYESVIGFGKIEPVEGEKKLLGLRAICEHYGYSNYDIENCKSLEKTAVYRIGIECLTGKRNLAANC